MEVLVKINERMEIKIMQMGQKTVTISQVNARQLSSLGKGDKFKIGNYVFMVLDQSGDTTAVIYAGFMYDNKNIAFDNKCNNWEESDLRKILNEGFIAELIAEVGAENIIEHKVDLTSLDGLKDYGSCMDKVSLLTVERYRQYRELLEEMPDLWWLATPWSTPKTGYSRSVCCVHSDGSLDGGDCGNAFCCVRPFCIFKSPIFVSLEDE